MHTNMTTENISGYRNNCVLVALKEVSGKSDDEIMSAVRRCNYKNDKGMYYEDYMRAARLLGVEIGEQRWHYDLQRISGDQFKRLTLAATIKQFLQRGTWLVRTDRHVFVVRDGKLIDRNWHRSASLGRRLVDITEVKNAFVAKLDGFVRVVRRTPRRPGTKAFRKFQDLRHFLDMYPKTTKDQLLNHFAQFTDGGGYDATDFAWDLKRGNVEIV